MFWDVVTSSEDMEKQRELVLSVELLGKGGFGFVCKGQLLGDPEIGTKVHNYYAALHFPKLIFDVVYWGTYHFPIILEANSHLYGCI